MNPTIGRIVIYREAIGDQSWPAIVTRVHSPTILDLTVFSGVQGASAAGVYQKRMVGEGKAVSQWSWPERV